MKIQNWIFIRSAGIFFLFFLAIGSSFGQQDSLFMNSGERINGSITSMDKGTLVFESANLGILRISTENIAGIKSNIYRDIITTNGNKYFAFFALGSEKGQVRLIMARDTVTIPITHLFTINNVGEELLDKINGMVSLGFNYTRSNATLQLNWGGTLNYRSFKRTQTVKYNGLINRNEVRVARRHDFTYDYNRNYNKGYFLYASGALQQNTELNILFRGQAAGGSGKNFIKKRDISFSGILAVNLNNEVTLEKENFTSLEGLVGIRYSQFNIAKPNMDITSNISFYPSITEKDRYRIDYELKLAWRLYEKISLSNSLFINFDSKNPQTGESLSDYNIAISVTYSI